MPALRKDYILMCMMSLPKCNNCDMYIYIYIYQYISWHVQVVSIFHLILVFTTSHDCCMEAAWPTSDSAKPKKQDKEDCQMLNDFLSYIGDLNYKCMPYKLTHYFRPTLSVRQKQCLSNVDADSLTHGDFFQGLGNFESVGSTPCDVVHLRHSWAKSKGSRLIASCLSRQGITQEEHLQQADFVWRTPADTSTPEVFLQHDASWRRIQISENCGDGTLNFWFQGVHTQYNQVLEQQLQILTRTLVRTCQNTYTVHCKNCLFVFFENTETGTLLVKGTSSFATSTGGARIEAHPMHDK